MIITAIIIITLFCVWLGIVTRADIFFYLDAGYYEKWDRLKAHGFEVIICSPPKEINRNMYEYKVEIYCAENKIQLLWKKLVILCKY